MIENAPCSVSEFARLVLEIPETQRHIAGVDPTNHRALGLAVEEYRAAHDHLRWTIRTDRAPELVWRMATEWYAADLAVDAHAHAVECGLAIAARLFAREQAAFSHLVEWALHHEASHAAE
jgi:hypothetical protein